MINSIISEYDTAEKERFQEKVSIPHIEEPVPRLIIDVLSEYSRNKIDLQPEFQRQFVWNKKKQKELIKSLCAGVPLPMFYFARTDKDRNEVVDGQQRLTTIFGFLKPKSLDKSLRSKIISNVKIAINGSKLSLPDIQRKIKNKKIYCVHLPETSIELKYEIFQVLNQGSTMLKPQEIRNCLLASEMPEFNNLVKDLARKLRNLTGMSLDRMLGEELALRFFVINKYGYEKDISNIMNNFSTIKSDFTAEEIMKMKRKSLFFIRTLKKIFGQDIGDCFQVLQKGIKLPQTNKWSLYPFSKKINQSLYHLLSYYIPKYTTHQLIKKNYSRIKKGYLDLLKNKRFVSVVTGSGTNSTKNIRRSKQIFKKVFLDKYLGDWSLTPKRNITVTEKRTLYKNVPFCYLCYGKFKKHITLQKIHADHIESFSQGKKSKTSNILLAHPRCNAEKKDISLEDYRNTEKSQKRRMKQQKNIEEYRKALREWNKAYKLDMFKKLMKFAKHDMTNS